MKIKDTTFWFILIFILNLLLLFLVLYFGDPKWNTETLFEGLAAIGTMGLLSLGFWKLIIEDGQNRKNDKKRVEKEKGKIATQLRYALETSRSNLKDLEGELNIGQCEFHNLSYILTPCYTGCWEREQDVLFSELKEHKDNISKYFKYCYEIDEHLKYAKEVFYSNVKFKNKLLYKEARKIFLEKREDFFNGKHTKKQSETYSNNLSEVSKLIDEQFYYDCTNQSMNHLSDLLKLIPDLDIIIKKLKKLEFELKL